MTMPALWTFSSALLLLIARILVPGDAVIHTGVRDTARSSSLSRYPPSPSPRTSLRRWTGRRWLRWGTRWQRSSCPAAGVAWCCPKVVLIARVPGPAPGSRPPHWTQPQSQGWSWAGRWWTSCACRPRWPGPGPGHCQSCCPSGCAELCLGTSPSRGCCQSWWCQSCCSARTSSPAWSHPQPPSSIQTCPQSRPPPGCPCCLTFPT